MKDLVQKGKSKHEKQYPQTSSPQANDICIVTGFGRGRPTTTTTRVLRKDSGHLLFLLPPRSLFQLFGNGSFFGNFLFGFTGSMLPIAGTRNRPEHVRDVSISVASVASRRQGFLFLLTPPLLDKFRLAGSFVVAPITSVRGSRTITGPVAFAARSRPRPRS